MIDFKEIQRKRWREHKVIEINKLKQKDIK